MILFSKITSQHINHTTHLRNIVIFSIINLVLEFSVRALNIAQISVKATTLKIYRIREKKNP